MIIKLDLDASTVCGACVDDRSFRPAIDPSVIGGGPIVLQTGTDSVPRGTLELITMHTIASPHPNPPRR